MKNVSSLLLQLHRTLLNDSHAAEDQVEDWVALADIPSSESSEQNMEECIRDVLDVLLQDECLQDVRAQVEEAGCDVLPDWACGAIVLVPLMEKEARAAGMELRAHHIVIVQEHQVHVERALTAIPKRRRPRARRADPEYINSSTTEVLPPNHDAAVDPEHLVYTPDHSDNCNAPWHFEWHVERTFVHFPLPQTEENSRSVKSEPCSWIPCGCLCGCLALDLLDLCI